jgi:hypothetical protein
MQCAYCAICRAMVWVFLHEEVVGHVLAAAGGCRSASRTRWPSGS